MLSPGRAVATPLRESRLRHGWLVAPFESINLGVGSILVSWGGRGWLQGETEEEKAAAEEADTGEKQKEQADTEKAEGDGGLGGNNG